MSLSGIFEIPRPSVSAQDMLQAKREFVMPAQAGIHLRSRCKAKENLDSGLRRNDGKKSRLPVDTFRIPWLKAEAI